MMREAPSDLATGRVANLATDETAKRFAALAIDAEYAAHYDRAQFYATMAQASATARVAEALEALAFVAESSS